MGAEDYQDAFDNRTGADFAALDAERFEEAVVEFLLQRFGLSRGVKFELLTQHFDEHGKRLLTLTDFYDRFPEFPVPLAVLKSARISEVTNLRHLVEVAGDEPGHPHPRGPDGGHRHRREDGGPSPHRQARG